MSCALEPHELTPSPDGETLLLAADFDGTIAPIVDRPEDAVIHECARRLLGRCAAAPSLVVAILSGRDVEDVRRRLGGLRAIVAGSHGLECVDADGRPLWSTPARLPEPDPALIATLEAAGLRVERKKFATAVHFRGRELLDLDPLLSPFVAWAHQAGLEVIGGRKVVEARVAGEGKRAALRRLAMLTKARRVVYAGDDTTDFEALDFAAEFGRAIFVASDERRPPDISPLSVVSSIEALCFGLIREVIEHAPRAASTLHR
jgi:trehalose-phosphatase